VLLLFAEDAPMTQDKRELTEEELESMDRDARADIATKPSAETVKRSSRIRRLVEEIRRERARTAPSDGLDP
jgi:hypothetical protein